MREEKILHYGRLPWPAPWSELFGREAPLVLEIGFGGGQFLIDLAQKRPFANVLGIEISLPSLRKGAKKVRLAGLNNVLALQGDSKAVLWLLCQPESLFEVFINFPDPWPKSGHQHRRLLNKHFLHLLATRMSAGANLDIATDHADYAEQISDCLEHTPYFDSRLETVFVTTDTQRLRTKYESIALAEGRVCHYYKWRRNSTPAPDPFFILEELVMPHVVMRTPANLNTISRAFIPFHLEEEGIHIKFMDVYQSTRDGKLLIEVFVGEEPYPQRLCLAIRSRTLGDMVISVHELGFPRPTRGVHLAVAGLVGWVTSLQPNFQIINSTLVTEPIEIR